MVKWIHHTRKFVNKTKLIISWTSFHKCLHQFSRSEREEPTFPQKILNSIVLVWYWRKLREAWASGDLKSKNDYMIDTSLLGILENFLENAPQLNITWFYVFWIHEEITFVPSIVMKCT